MPMITLDDTSDVSLRSTPLDSRRTAVVNAGSGRSEIAPSARTLWIDVTTILRWDRPVVGVVRVEERLARWVLDHPTEFIRFCCYDQSLRAFLEVSTDQVAARLALYEHPQFQRNVAHRADLQTAPAPKKKKRKKKGLTKILAFLADQSRQGYGRMRMLLSIASKARSGRKSPDQRSNLAAAASTPRIFQIGDAYLSVGADWDDKDLRRLYELKEMLRLKVVGMCYDAIPVKFPHLTLGETARRFPRYLTDLAWVCDHVLCISACTERDFREFVSAVGAPVPETSVVTLGSNLLRDGESRVTRQADIGPEGSALGAGLGATVAEATKAPFILYVSTIERRKNHETLYKAWVRLIESGYDVPKLLCVGMRGWGVNDLLADLACDPRIRRRIRVLHDLSDTELAYLYRACLFTVYPSLYEGWGLPVVESLAFGKFCLCSNAGSLVEAGGTFAEYLDPWDVAAWADRVRYLTEHPDEVERRNRHIEMSFKPHVWCDTVQSILGSVRAMTGVDYTINDSASTGQLQ